MQPSPSSAWAVLVSHHQQRRREQQLTNPPTTPGDHSSPRFSRLPPPLTRVPARCRGNKLHTAPPHPRILLALSALCARAGNLVAPAGVPARETGLLKAWGTTRRQRGWVRGRCARRARHGDAFMPASGAGLKLRTGIAARPAASCAGALRMSEEDGEVTMLNRGSFLTYTAVAALPWIALLAKQKTALTEVPAAAAPAAVEGAPAAAPAAAAAVAAPAAK
eukprot:CAMPEP_0180281492 /NCGR_PEP_ID=MMETSP0988-20121125/9238_1 /TAXON_ID=697907 /ORGANISM="non described non described, Strain CCMP2293" /LENGTH=220 /DNA_ID=CAMNT_0022253495 /DNA_START=142 /DNA_END=804 /DNA_ORIENTATION=+